jgi:hypothetical protein
MGRPDYGCVLGHGVAGVGIRDVAHRVAQAKQLIEDPAHPSRPELEFGTPLGVSDAEHRRLAGEPVQAVGQRANEHRYGEKGAARLHEREPFGVVALDMRAGHQSLTSSGRSNSTAAGNSRWVGFA